MGAGGSAITLSSEQPSLPISTCYTPAWNHRNQSRELEKPYSSVEIQHSFKDCILRPGITLLIACEAVIFRAKGNIFVSKTFLQFKENRLFQRDELGTSHVNSQVILHLL